MVIDRQSIGLRAIAYRPTRLLGVNCNRNTDMSDKKKQTSEDGSSSSQETGTFHRDEKPAGKTTRG